MFISDDAKCKEIAAKLDALGKLDPPKCAEVKDNLKKRFHSEQDDDVLNTSISDALGALTHLANLHGKLYNCREILKVQVDGLELRTAPALARAMADKVRKSVQEINEPPTLDRSEVGSTLKLTSTFEFINAVHVLKDYLQEETSAGLAQLHGASRQHTISMRDKIQRATTVNFVDAFLLLRCYKLETLLADKERFKTYFTTLIESPSFSGSKTRTLGDELIRFMKDGGEVGDAARRVIENISAFQQYRTEDYNRKAGGVAPEAGVRALKMKSIDRPMLRPNTTTLLQAFEGFRTVFQGKVSEIVGKKIDARWPDKNLKEARGFARTLDPTRLYMNATQVGKLLACIAAQLCVLRLPQSGGGVKKNSLFIPHTTQLLGTFLLLGLGAHDDLQNQMVSRLRPAAYLGKDISAT